MKVHHEGHSAAVCGTGARLGRAVVRAGSSEERMARHFWVERRRDSTVVQRPTTTGAMGSSPCYTSGAGVCKTHVLPSSGDRRRGGDEKTHRSLPFCPFRRKTKIDRDVGNSHVSYRASHKIGKTPFNMIAEQQTTLICGNGLQYLVGAPNCSLSTSVRFC
jgi:hypothetical protein